MPKKKKKSVKATVPTPRQPRLPTLEDPEITVLHEAAMDYAEIRDRRLALTPQEAELKAKLLILMKANNKLHYHHDGVEISVVHENEKVKVKITREET